MAIDIKAPTFPESVADGTVATWHKQPGEAVKRDELLVDIETDKVVMEVLAEADGVLAEILMKEGDTVLSGALLGRLGEGGAVPLLRLQQHLRSLQQRLRHQLQKPRYFHRQHASWQKKVVSIQTALPAPEKVAVLPKRTLLPLLKPKKLHRRRLRKWLHRLPKHRCLLAVIGLKSVCQ